MAGRPKRVFSDEEKAKIEEYALNNCKTETIANALNIPVNTLKRHFGRKMKQKRAEHRVNLRQYQQTMAKTAPAMAIFLGKNELNQADKQEIKQTGSVATPLTEAEQRASEAAARVYKLRLAQGA